MAKPRLLFLCQATPFPPDGGVAIRSYNILRLLAEVYDVTALCFYRRAVLRNLKGSTDELNRLSRAEAFPIPQEFSSVRFVVDHLVSLVTGHVYTVEAYESESFRRRVREEVRTGGYALAHVDSLDLSGYLGELKGMPVICVHHNVESALLERRAVLEKSAWRAAYLRLQARRMQREEQRWCPRVALNVAVSPDDEALLKRLVPGIRTSVVPNGVDIEAFSPAEQVESGVVFVGGMTWFPNRDALEYFAADILPLLRASGVQVPVTWVGRAFEDATAAYARLGVTLTGYVDDIRPYVLPAACYVVPLRVGGGTRLKILDAWAMGKAVVSSSVGCEGLDARDGWNIIIRDDPASFAAAIREVLQNERLRHELGANARRTAESTYSWHGIGERMIETYEQVRCGRPA